MKYKIKIEADYEDLNLNKDDEYIVEYKMLYKCSYKLWIELFEKHNIHNRKSNLEDIMNNSSSYNEEEIEFISKYNEEFN